MSFTIYPALDLRHGKVVRLTQGDPRRMTLYGEDAVEVARRWLEQGARWLHVVNLDGAFGEASSENRHLLPRLIALAQAYGARIQFGGGLRSPEAIAQALSLGLHRVVIGTLAVTQPEVLQEALERFGREAIAVALDAQGTQLRVQGWQSPTNYTPIRLAQELCQKGVGIFIYTDTDRDGLQVGLNLEGLRHLLALENCAIIASGGVRDLEDVQAAYRLGCHGVILGRALYEGKIHLQEALNVGETDHSLP